jgi:hydrogenase maturation protein HypF
VDAEPTTRAQGRARWAVRVRGTVQAVGFRPAVQLLAERLGLAGSVRNDGAGVWIEIEGAPEALTTFCAQLKIDAPPRARIESLEHASIAARGETRFRILPSGELGAGGARAPADLAPCDACLAELDDPNDRRFRHPFINCTDCGPRYSIIRDLPYDRSRTTMDVFLPCPACRREYEDPHSRRFHAEPIACPACGPQLRYLVQGQPPLGGEAALAAAVQKILEGGIVAIKGAGGFLLAVDAQNELQVARLRARKRRPNKPLAVMARDLAWAERLALLDDPARRALIDPARPIVIVPLRPGAPLAPSVAPGLREVGLMLPSTPLHQLLLQDGPAWQVMTSGNRREEPIACDDATALSRLGEIADGFLTHDRAIHTRVDDSVVRVVAGAIQPVRRARGLAPDPIPAEWATTPLLALGGELKSTICLARGGEAFVSQHLGDLGGQAALEFFEETVEKLARLVGARPELVAHDLHPDYRSTRFALDRGLPRIAVQHHHAHVASCLAEHGRFGPAIGVAFDGNGCGPAGEQWGGEFLFADLSGFRRHGHLRPLRLAGGDRAVTEPWRLALSALKDAHLDARRLARIEPARRRAVERLLAADLSSPKTTSAGRWFDAVAALCAVRDEISYEAQAAIELEALAQSGAHEPFPFLLQSAEPFAIDLRPAVRGVLEALDRGVPVGEIAARFYETMAEVVASGCRRVRDATGLELVALSGGCFQSARLTERSCARLRRDGFDVLLHRRVPPNDGGLSLGQAAVAAHQSPNRRSAHVPRHPR